MNDQHPHPMQQITGQVQSLFYLVDEPATTLTIQLDMQLPLRFNLTYTDRASMAASCEVRVPFVDPLVFEAAFALPGSEKIRGRTQKAALKDVARAWLPVEVVDRPKASFGAPLRAWITHDLAPVIDDTLVGGELVASGFIQKQPLLRMVEEQRAGKRDWSKQLWELLTLETWYRNVRSAGVGSR